MGFFRAVGRLMAYPVLRPMETMRDASAQIRADLEVARAAREQRLALRSKQAEEAAKSGSGELTAEQLLNPKLIRDPRRRFQAVAELNRWTEEELGDQLVAVRRGRRFALISACLVLFFAVVTFVKAPVWVVLVLAPCLFVGCVVAVTQGFKYGLYQWQLEDRCLYGPADYLSRADFLRHLLSW